MKKQDIVALIPARGGSKGIPRKNIRSFAGKPLVSWSIEYALSSKKVDRVIVSTDDAEIADIAREWGAEVPFLRPGEISGDFSTDLEVFQHALTWISNKEEFNPELCVHLRPTYPIRREGLLDEMLAVIQQSNQWDSVRTVSEVQHTPFKMWFRRENGQLEPIRTHETIAEPWNEPRQRLPTAYLQTANIDIVRSRVILEQGSMTGKNIFGFIDHQCYDIDNETDFQRVESKFLHHLKTHQRLAGKGVLGSETHKVFCFDFDGVLATLVPNGNYAKALPIAHNIECLRQLHQQGHRIIIYTARGTMTGKDWVSVTRRQCREWGIPFHELTFGKPAADFYLDDRMSLIEDLPSIIQKLQALSPENKESDHE